MYTYTQKDKQETASIRLAAVRVLSGESFIWQLFLVPIFYRFLAKSFFPLSPSPLDHSCEDVDDVVAVVAIGKLYV